MVEKKAGCLLWAVLFVFLALWGWQLLNFFVLEPAAFRKDLNGIVENVNRIQNTQTKQCEFQLKWAEYEAASQRSFTMSTFMGDSFVVEWEDTLHVPVFPSIPHTFHQTRLIR